MGINLPDYISVGSRGKFTFTPATSADNDIGVSGISTFGYGLSTTAATTADTTPPDKPVVIEIGDD